MVIHHGASGGPVAGPSGRVFGLNSTGFDGTEEFYISRIDEIFSLEVFLDEGGQESVTIQHLLDQGAVTLDA
jgi:S1-C subfamily serine protease